jgi:hypothetical protein
MEALDDVSGMRTPPHDLHGDDARKRRIGAFRTIDGAHPAATDDVDDSPGTQRRADEVVGARGTHHDVSDADRRRFEELA